MYITCSRAPATACSIGKARQYEAATPLPEATCPRGQAARDGGQLSFSPAGVGRAATAGPDGDYGALPATHEPMTDGSRTKAALIEQVAHAADLTKKRAAIIVDTLFGSIAEALHHGEKVELRGFGSFRLRCRGPHRGRNPRTADRVDVPLKRVPLPCRLDRAGRRSLR